MLAVKKYLATSFPSPLENAKIISRPGCYFKKKILAQTLTKKNILAPKKKHTPPHCKWEAPKDILVYVLGLVPMSVY